MRCGRTSADEVSADSHHEAKSSEGLHSVVVVVLLSNVTPRSLVEDTREATANAAVDEIFCQKL